MFVNLIACECGDHDPEVYICCNDVLNPRPPFAMCCQTKAINNQLYQCCNGVINPRPAGDARCCQHNSFNGITHMCCDGTVNERPGGNDNCCKHIGFDRDTHRCCPDHPMIVPIGIPCPPTLQNHEESILAKEHQRKTHRLNPKHKVKAHKP